MSEEQSISFNLNGIDDTQPPDFTSTTTKGQTVQWWKCKPLTEWAHREDLHGIALPTVHVWVVKDPEGTQYVITEGQQYEYATQGFEDAASHIDVMKAAQQFSPGK